jgi:hypothetical protein
MLTLGKLWRLWAKSLGDKASDNSTDADAVALMRTAVVLVNFFTCFFIVAGVLRHW